MGQSRTKSTVRKILLMLHFGGASGRELLQGIFSLISPAMHWHTRILTSMDTIPPEALRNILEECPDGIITSELASDTVATFLAHSKTPLVVIGQSDIRLYGRTSRISFVHNDDRGIGQTAARHLLSLGDFRSYLYLPARNGIRWSEERERGFRETLAEAGRTCRSVPLHTTEENDADLVSIRRALKQAEKPCGVFAAWDGRALHALTICAESGISVPGQVAVLGVDNDELICDYARPNLSSVKPDHHLVGRMAAAELTRLMREHGRGKNTEVRQAFCRCRGVVERESTRPLPPSAQLTRRALRFIHEHATEGISVTDVATHLGVSRRLADLRLRQNEGTSIGKLILARKLETVGRLLATSHLPLRRIADRCGFGNMKHLQRTFRTHYGMSMSDYRLRHAASGDGESARGDFARAAPRGILQGKRSPPRADSGRSKVASPPYTSARLDR